MACVFSTGHQFERVESEMWSRDAVLALALDGMGTIAVDQLAARTLAKIRNHYAHFPDLKIYRLSLEEKNGRWKKASLKSLKISIFLVIDLGSFGRSNVS